MTTNAARHRRTGNTITITRTIELDIEIDLEVTPGTADHYDRSIGGPGGWSPGSPAEAEIAEIRTTEGTILRIASELSRSEIEAIQEQAIEELGEREEDSRAAAEEDAWEARRERDREDRGREDY